MHKPVVARDKGGNWRYYCAHCRAFGDIHKTKKTADRQAYLFKNYLPGGEAEPIELGEQYLKEAGLI